MREQYWRPNHGPEQSGNSLDFPTASVHDSGNRDDELEETKRPDQHVHVVLDLKSRRGNYIASVFHLYDVVHDYDVPVLNSWWT